ncbi:MULTISPECIES: acyl-CoA dehydratase activase [unclassified Pyramidobacter]|uniref:acyl-CoA dehydratase activase n=1 Tax=unclassified Pyramidobacter TaxID=2632171 RepID=UPI0025DA2E4B|nr:MULTISPECIES: acyl-CoA dehydratase activase [unclassified Pyramidobacter]MCI7404421.1 acyl-CoA dehydratase activase [Pyramidobacter sp.]MDY3211460.1 acyl-CoA dehydratase activase [Pyramidobacter sp.]WOL40689.1 acyl-CoA dehydratase activase [Pyramidobacter sp. YE332]
MTAVRYAGIDIGSTASKAVVMDEAKERILERKIMPSGWNGRETAAEFLDWLRSLGYAREELRITATGYGRVSVPYADETLTEITCHGRGACFLGGKDLAVIDIGGQDTKVILTRGGRVTDFIMNDKCSAGTGKFLEIMANRLGLTMPELFDLAEHGREITISSMCTVFAESEIVSLMGLGTPREDIACGAVRSVVAKVATLAGRKAASGVYFLTGGFCESPLMVRKLSAALRADVRTAPDARFAGAIGAALLSK